ncbi:SCO family protein [Legionella taurinensis]|uniref:SCO family protein n=1 Tax=Legionella taurinensis TaxID=70611 RepID=A0A3A5LF80_9GAMM|nr:SCO family protein [Legionella taurinensis]MDX1837534.1 SCO family protein [Legionella taurinensis]PUT40871.1 SCO family protein [Legionella taurinensis]PUT44292.1 SCO family protein [Legionella taurinensis]PUT47594.1 SCO family protein [Legionella taurinensis]PUT48733.1 SCO family protein [Legionella taurinensis]
MTAQKNRINLTVILLLALVALVTGFFVSQHLHKGKKIDVSQFHGTLLETPRGVNEFSLTGIDNQPFNNQSLKGQWTLVFFGFTSCGYLCPTTMAELAKMYRSLEEKGVNPLPRVVMISIDPERDDLPKLAGYVKSFDPHFYGARGESKAIKKMTREMGIAYAKVAMPTSQDAQNYDVQHSGTVMLFNPEGELSAFFTTPHQALTLAKDYQLLVG